MTDPAYTVTRMHTTPLVAADHLAAAEEHLTAATPGAAFAGHHLAAAQAHAQIAGLRMQMAAATDALAEREAEKYPVIPVGQTEPISVAVLNRAFEAAEFRAASRPWPYSPADMQIQVIYHIRRALEARGVRI